jgi:predicted KAP-like P-loop ATPase
MRAETNETNPLHTDTPIRTPAEDELERRSFAEQLFKVIRNLPTDDGYVVALNGPWGSGKSSILNMVEHYAGQEEEGQVFVFRFNPWWFSGDNQLLNHFFDQFQALLGSTNISQTLQNVGDLVGKLATILSPVEMVLSMHGVPLPISKGMKEVGDAARAAGGLTERNLEKVKGQIDERLRKQDTTILVIIDDIDRLTPEEVRQVFKLVKAVGNFPRTIYLLAFDHGVVTKALQSAHNFADQDFIDKIVQLPLDVPPPGRSSLRKMLFDGLNKIIAGTPDHLWDSTEWGNVFWEGIDPFIRTPRLVKRLLNRVAASYPLVEGDVHGVDFVAIQSLRVFAPNVFDALASNKDMLTRIPTDREGRTPRDAFLESVVAMVTAEKREAVKDLIHRLFPALSGHYGSDWSSEWRKKARVASADVFDRYFALTLLEGDFGDSEMRVMWKLVTEPGELEKRLIELTKERRADGTSRARLFLERMQDYTHEEFPDKDIEPFLIALFNAGDEIELADEKTGMFDLGNSMSILRVAYQLLKRLPNQEQRFNLLRAICSQATSIYMPVRAVIVMGQEHGKHGAKGEETPEAEREISSTHLLILETLLAEKILAASKNGRLAQVPHLPRVLYAWSSWEGGDPVKKYVADLVAADNEFATYVQHYLSISFSHSISDRVAKRTATISLENLVEFLGLTPLEVVERAERILATSPDWLDEKALLALQILVETYRYPKDSFGRTIVKETDEEYDSATPNAGDGERDG